MPLSFTQLKEVPMKSVDEIVDAICALNDAEYMNIMRIISSFMFSMEERPEMLDTFAVN